MLVSGRDRTTIEWACANRTGENYKVTLYLACGRVKNAVIVCLETWNICLADAQTPLSAIEVLICVFPYLKVYIGMTPAKCV